MLLSDEEEVGLAQVQSKYYQQKTFYAAAAVALNKLPLTVRTSKSTDIFIKSRLDDHWGDLLLKYDHLATPPLDTPGRR